MDFSQRTIDRIAASVRKTELMQDAEGAAFGRTYEQDDSDLLSIYQLTANLAPGGTATANPYTWSAASKSYSADSSTTVTVADKVSKFRTLSGQLVLCQVLGNTDTSTTYSVLETLNPQAQIIKVGISSTPVAANATFNSTTCDVMDRGGDPSSAGVVTGIQNGPIAIPASSTGIICIWDEGIGKYLADYQSANVQWGIVQSTPTNQPANTALAVSVKACQADGSGPSGSPFNVYTPILGAASTSGATGCNQYTAVFSGDVVGFVTTGGANAFTIVTPCFDDPFGTIRLLYTSAAYIPNGWTDITSTLNNYFPMISSSTPGTLNAGDQHTHSLTSSCAFQSGSAIAADIGTATGGATVTAPVGDAGANVLKPANVTVRAIYRTS